MRERGRGTLLMVEDEHRLRSLVAHFLRCEGFEVVEAGDGPEGVERYADSGPFDLVLVDLNLPVFSGVEVCRRIKRPARPAGDGLQRRILGDHERALDALGVDHYLTKPYHPEDLIAHIAQEIGPRCDRPARVLARPPIAMTGRRPTAAGNPSPSFDYHDRWNGPSLAPRRGSGTLRHRDRFSREGRFHGWETAESSRTAAPERRRRATRPDGGRGGRTDRRRRGRRRARTKAKKKKAPAKKAKATKAAKPAARMRIVWTVMNDAFKPVGTFEYAQKEAAEARAAELTAKGKGPHFVQKTKEPMPDNAPGLGDGDPRRPKSLRPRPPSKRPPPRSKTTRRVRTRRRARSRSKTNRKKNDPSREKCRHRRFRTSDLTLNRTRRTGIVASGRDRT